MESEDLRGKRNVGILSADSGEVRIPFEEVIENTELRPAVPSRLRIKTQKPSFKVCFLRDSPCKAEALESSPTLAPVTGRGDPHRQERFPRGGGQAAADG